jgi:hypothetical protein
MTLGEREHAQQVGLVHDCAGGIAGLQMNRMRQRDQTSAGTASRSGRKPVAAVVSRYQGSAPASSAAPS